MWRAIIPANFHVHHQQRDPKMRLLPLRLPGWPFKALLLAILPVASAAAGTLTLHAGTYLLARVDTEINVRVNGVSGSFNPKDALGLQYDTAVARISADYAFNEAHAVQFSWYSIGSRGERVLDQDIDWPDDSGNIIGAGSGVRSDMRFRILRAGYRWTFHHDDKVDLAVGAGVHLTEVTIGLEARVTSGGGSVFYDSRSASVTMPLPVLGMHLGYRITPRWDWQIDSEWFALQFGDYRGGYLDSTLTLGYRLTPRLRIGAGLAANTLEVTRDDGTERFDVRNTINGGLLYLGYRF